MEVVIVDDATVGAGMVADTIATLVRDRPGAVLGLATGSTPLPVYDALVRRHEDGPEFRRVSPPSPWTSTWALLLDDPASYRSVLRREFTDRVDLPAQRLHTPDGLSEDLPGACEAYEQAIHEAGGIDVQLLGVGTDGHIGFNEPTSSLGSVTRDQDADRADHQRQRPVLRRRPHAGSHGTCSRKESRRSCARGT